MRQRGGNGDFQHQERRLGAKGSRHVVIGVADARHAGPGQHRNRKSRRQRDQEGACAPARGKGEKGKGQPCRRRQWSDESQHRMHPVADAARPSDRYAGQEADRRADGVAAELKFDGCQDAVQQLGKVVGVDFDDGLRRRKERQRQPRELCGRDLPQAQEQSQRPQPWRTLLQALPETAEQTAAQGRSENAARDDECSDGKAMGTRPLAEIFPQQAGEPKSDPRQTCEYRNAVGQK